MVSEIGTNNKKEKLYPTRSPQKVVWRSLHPPEVLQSDGKGILPKKALIYNKLPRTNPTEVSYNLV